MNKSSYLTIYESIAEEIQSGVYLPGMNLLSENELAEKYSVSRPTIRKAIQMLIAKGMVFRQQGKPSVVTGNSMRPENVQYTFGIDLNPHGANSGYYNGLLNGIQSVLDPCGHKLRMYSSTQVFSIAPGELNGLILLDTDNDQRLFDKYAKIAAGGTPIVMINRIPRNPELSYVSVEDNDATRRFLRAVIRGGASRMACYAKAFGYNPRISSRIQAWKQAYKECSLQYDPELLFLENTEQEQRRFVSLLKERRIDAVFAIHIKEVFPVLRCIYEAGLRIPEDIEIFCFDNAEWLTDDLLEIPISYVKIPLQRMGSIAMSYLLSASASSQPQILRRILEPAFVFNQCKFLA